TNRKLMNDVAIYMSQIRHNDLQTYSHTFTEEHKALQSSAKICVPEFFSSTTASIDRLRLG
ncbi:TPA: hypothetical protein ACHUW9_004318, partial [Shigella flexneri]